MLHIHTTYLDNEKNLSPEFVEEVQEMKNKNPEKYAHLVIGQWADVAEGAIFPTIYECDEFPDWAEKVALGMDFGYTNDPTAIIMCGIVGDDLYFDELTYRTRMLSKDIIKVLKAYDMDVESESADPRLIDEIYLSGVNIYAVEKGKGSIIAGLDYMQSKRIHITKRSFNLLREFRNYVWDKDKDGNYINQPVDAWNHGIDSCRYYCLGKLLGKVKTRQNDAQYF